jgi:hypothetical protein
MGVCCVKQHNQDKDEFRDTKRNEENLNLCKDENMSKEKSANYQEEVQSEPPKVIHNSNYSEVIERANKRNVEFVTEELAPEPQNLALQVVSENTKVRELEEKLGAFKSPEPLNDAIKRETRATILLDNGAKYTGQW